MAYTRDSKSFDWRDFAQSIWWLPRSFRWGFQSLKKPIPITVGVAVLAIFAVRRQFIFMPAMLLYPVALSLLYYLGRVLLTFLQALTTTLHGWTEALLGAVRDAYVRSLAGVIKRSAWVLIGSGIFLVATIAVIASQVSFSFIPQSDNGVMSISLRLPPGLRSTSPTG